MARFTGSRGRRNSSKRDRRDSGSRSRRNFGDSPRGRRDSGRGFGRDRREVEMTKVTCSSCGVECEVPFKPSSSKPVYCDECFAKKDKSRSSGRGLDVINEKLDKIMKALKIEWFF